MEKLLEKLLLVHYAAGFGILLGLLNCLFASLWLKRRPVLENALEAFTGGVFIVISLHLGYCSIEPAELIHLCHSDGSHLHDKDIQVHLGEFHALDLIVGCIAGTWLAGVLAIRSLKFH